MKDKTKERMERGISINHLTIEKSSLKANKFEKPKDFVFEKKDINLNKLREKRYFG